MKKSTILQCFQAFILLFSTYGMLYFSYKYYTPWQGGLDYAEYYPMYLHPLDFAQAKAPFIYRQLSAVITHFIYQLGLYYPNKIAFSEPAYEQRIFFSALLSNYIALLGTALIVAKTVTHSLKKGRLFAPLVAGWLCFLSFLVQQSIVTGLTEGWSWFLVALGYYAYVSRKLPLLLGVLVFSIFQRETIPMVFGVIAAIDFIISLRNKKTDRFYAAAFMLSCVSEITYLFIRKIFLPVSGNEEQLNLSSSIANLAHSFPPSKELIMQGFLSQNIYFIFLGAIIVVGLFKKSWQILESGLIPISVALFFLSLIGLASGIGNNIGRIVAILTPILAVLSVLRLTEIEELAEY